MAFLSLSRRLLFFLSRLNRIKQVIQGCLFKGLDRKETAFELEIKLSIKSGA